MGITPERKLQLDCSRSGGGSAAYSTEAEVNKAIDLALGLAIRYATKKPKHPRYKWLPQKIVETAVLQYAKGVPFSSLDFSKQAMTQMKLVKASFEWPTRPNGFLLSVLQKLNSDRLIARLEQNQLKNVFASPAWDLMFDGADNLSSQDVVPVMAANIQKVISKFTFQGPRPSIQQIQTILTNNLRDEITMQTERIQRQAANLGKNALQFQPWINESLKEVTPKPAREGMGVIRNAQEFYKQLLGLQKITEIDKIAMSIETDDQFLNTAVAILLADRGIDLHDYSTNLRQSSLAFHTSGLDSALEYLGISMHR